MILHAWPDLQAVKQKLLKANKLLRDLSDVLNGECEDKGNLGCQCEHCNAEIRTFNALDKYLKEERK